MTLDTYTYSLLNNTHLFIVCKVLHVILRTLHLLCSLSKQDGKFYWKSNIVHNVMSYSGYHWIHLSPEVEWFGSGFGNMKLRFLVCLFYEIMAFLPFPSLLASLLYLSPNFLLFISKQEFSASFSGLVHSLRQSPLFSICWKDKMVWTRSKNSKETQLPNVVLRYTQFCSESNREFNLPQSVQCTIMWIRVCPNPLQYSTCVLCLSSNLL